MHAGRCDGSGATANRMRVPSKPLYLRDCHSTAQGGHIYHWKHLHVHEHVHDSRTMSLEPFAGIHGGIRRMPCVCVYGLLLLGHVVCFDCAAFLGHGHTHGDAEKPTTARPGWLTAAGFLSMVAGYCAQAVIGAFLPAMPHKRRHAAPLHLLPCTHVRSGWLNMRVGAYEILFACRLRA